MEERVTRLMDKDINYVFRLRDSLTVVLQEDSECLTIDSARDLAELLEACVKVIETKAEGQYEN